MNSTCAFIKILRINSTLYTPVNTSSMYAGSYKYPHHLGDVAKKVVALIFYGRRGCLTRKPRCEGLGKAKQISTEASVKPLARVEVVRSSSKIICEILNKMQITSVVSLEET